MRRNYLYIICYSAAMQRTWDKNCLPLSREAFPVHTCPAWSAWTAFPASVSQVFTSISAVNKGNGVHYCLKCILSPPDLLSMFQSVTLSRGGLPLAYTAWTCLPKHDCFQQMANFERLLVRYRLPAALHTIVAHLPYSIASPSTFALMCLCALGIRLALLRNWVLQGVLCNILRHLVS